MNKISQKVAELESQTMHFGSQAHILYKSANPLSSAIIVATPPACLHCPLPLLFTLCYGFFPHALSLGCLSLANRKAGGCYHQHRRKEISLFLCNSHSVLGRTLELNYDAYYMLTLLCFPRFTQWSDKIGIQSWICL